MRQLGSFFHIAMNGMAASDKIFRLLDAEEPAGNRLAALRDSSIRCLRGSASPMGEDGARTSWPR